MAVVYLKKPKTKVEFLDKSFNEEGYKAKYKTIWDERDENVKKLLDLLINGNSISQLLITRDLTEKAIQELTRLQEQSTNEVIVSKREEIAKLEDEKNRLSKDVTDLKDKKEILTQEIELLEKRRELLNNGDVLKSILDITSSLHGINRSMLESTQEVAQTLQNIKLQDSESIVFPQYVSHFSHEEMSGNEIWLKNNDSTTSGKHI